MGQRHGFGAAGCPAGEHQNCYVFIFDIREVFILKVGIDQFGIVEQPLAWPVDRDALPELGKLRDQFFRHIQVALSHEQIFCIRRFEHIVQFIRFGPEI